MNDRGQDTLRSMQIHRWRLDHFGIYASKWMIKDGILQNPYRQMNDRGWSALRFVLVDERERMKYFEICEGKWIIEDRALQDLCRWIDDRGQSTLRFVQVDE